MIYQVVHSKKVRDELGFEILMMDESFLKVVAFEVEWGRSNVNIVDLSGWLDHFVSDPNAVLFWRFY